MEKTETLFFTRKRIGEEVRLKLYGQELKRVKTFKFLGIWLDERVTWSIHIDKVVDKCKKVLNVMRCLAGTKWGADKAALRNVYTALIRSVIEYGLIVYGSAAYSSLQKLDRVQAQALRICCGAVRSTPVLALQVEVGEIPFFFEEETVNC